MSRYYDFDAAAGEPDPIVFRILGRDWTLPATVPAAVLLKYDRLLLHVAEVERTKKVPDGYVVDADTSVEGLARSMAGDEVVDQWIAAGIDFRTLQKAVSRLDRIHRGKDPGLGEGLPCPACKGTGRAPAEESPSPTSSPAGQT